MIEMDTMLSQQNLKREHRPRQQERTSYPIRALIHKSIAVQRKSVFTNVCQIVTPLICLLFTVVVQEIVGDKVVSRIGSLKYPQPFNIPGMLSLLPQFNLTCKQFYLYQSSGPVEHILNRTLSSPCEEAGKPTPYFVKSTDINSDVLKKIDETLNETFMRNQDLKADIPDGTILFNKLDETQLNITLAINDLRLPEYHRSNGITKIKLNSNESAMFNGYLRTTEGAMSILDLITRAYLSMFKHEQIILSSIMYMPFSGEDRSLLNRIVNVIGSGLYPLGLSLLLPVFLYSIVSEKEEKLLENMKANGLTMGSYWLVTFLFNFTLSFITSSIFYISGRFIFKLSYFTETSATLMLIIMLGWMLAQISMANFVQVFISRARTATIIGYIMGVFIPLFSQALVIGVFPEPLTLPLCKYFRNEAMRMYPSIALCRLFYKMSFACSNGSCFSSISQIDDEMVSCIVVLYCSLILFFLSIYLYEVVQQEYGVKKNLLFFLNRQKASYQSFNSQIEQDEAQAEDSSVRDQKIAVSKKPYCPLVIDGIEKKYEISNGRENYTAVKPVSFTIKENEIFGLLGPNGAGKTSLISVLTGLYPPTKGDAYIEGYSIREDLSRIRMLIGVCPQFDLLWHELSPDEHLYFYARLKGISEERIKQMVDGAIQQVNLTAFRSLPSEKLSGGMKRRLSIAIALVGNPSLVFLDEPSSGLDPQHRRSLWNILLKCRKKRSILLTTHSMEQADTLCSRIGIITHGTLRCVGSQTQLKLKFGSGYNLIFNLKKSDDEEMKQKISQLDEFVKRHIKTKSCTVFNNNIVYKLEKKNNPISRFFKELIAKKAQLDIEDWAISQPSLYDVFIKVVDTEDSQGQMSDME